VADATMTHIIGHNTKRLHKAIPFVIDLYGVCMERD
jgi:hypothetical protein